MKGLLIGLAFVLLVSCVYIGAVSNVTGVEMRPPTLHYILTEITAIEYYSNVQDIINDIEDVWNDDSTYASSGGGENDGGFGRIDDDTPEWVQKLSTWLETTPIGKVFMTIRYAIEFVVMAIYDSILAVVYTLKIFSVLLTGIPV